MNTMMDFAQKYELTQQQNMKLKITFLPYTHGPYIKREKNLYL